MGSDCISYYETFQPKGTNASADVRFVVMKREMHLIEATDTGQDIPRDEKCIRHIIGGPTV
jgi:hypothetical protein